ncbi:hypothetical protein BCR32DRAFT_269133 [Anaeromyces robustus]|uniref:Uncharacterized protein n=1 Tax=Anaeromyces robustus TaxID=1754192 RepID=A0A1Y1X2D8_9FUNG|nr:hypothetical protein BCR32DRAFT_269133 [Anaeromyces robustus]|eukprot:ORX79960.1 hypothetical protein BCR32DRAFT_269133 [Anaeromyces robustus]
MNISANNKYLRCISNRTAATIYLVYMLGIYLFCIFFGMVEIENKISLCLVEVFFGFVILFFIFSIYRIMKTGKVDSNDYLSTGQFIICLILCIAILICYCVIYIITSNKQSVIDNYRKSYEKKHPNDLKLNDSEISKKYRYDKIVPFSIFYFFYCIFNLCLYQITYNEYIKEYNEE